MPLHRAPPEGTCACSAPLHEGGGGSLSRFIALRSRPLAGLCVGGGGRGVSPFLPGLPVGPVWPHWHPRVGSLPIIAGLRCRPGVRPCIAPRPVRYALRPDPGSLPQDHPGSGVVAPWLPPGQLHSISSASPSSPCCPVCCVCIGAFTAGGARGSEAASTAYSIWRCVCGGGEGGIPY